MDVFYYWKNHDADLKAGHIGYLKSTADKLKELADGFPDYLWVFKTPRGRKGDVQLLARLKWIDKATVKRKIEPGSVFINYDPLDSKSVFYTDSGSDTAVAATTDWVARHFPKMTAANFQGITGQTALRGSELKEIQIMAATFPSQPFSSIMAVPV
jgi:hypothetical protein